MIAMFVVMYLVTALHSWLVFTLYEEDAWNEMSVLGHIATSIGWPIMLVLAIYTKFTGRNFG